MICELFFPPFPHINVENFYFCVAQGSAVKIINITNRGRGKKTGNEGKNVFQNIFAHDCSFQISGRDS